MPTLIAKAELKGPLPRFFCPYCEKHRYWDYASGLEASIFGRYIICQCRTCGNFTTWGQ